MTTPSSNSNGWVALSERKPTKEDANKSGIVFVLFADGTPSIWYAYNNLGQPNVFSDSITHWMTPLPPPESPEQRQARLDEEAIEVGRELFYNKASAGVADAIRAAFAHARRKEDGK